MRRRRGENAIRKGRGDMGSMAFFSDPGSPRPLLLWRAGENPFNCRPPCRGLPHPSSFLAKQDLPLVSPEKGNMPRLQQLVRVKKGLAFLLLVNVVPTVAVRPKVSRGQRESAGQRGVGKGNHIMAHPPSHLFLSGGGPSLTPFLLERHFHLLPHTRRPHRPRRQGCKIQQPFFKRNHFRRRFF